MTKSPAGLVGGVGVEGAGGSLVLEALVVVVVVVVVLVVGDHLWQVVAPHAGRRRHDLGVREGVRRGEGR